MAGRRKWLKRSLALAVLIAVGVTAFFIYYHPPMRLMPAPLIFQDTGVDLAGRAPALVDGSGI